MADSILYKNLDGKYLTIKDLVKEEEATRLIPPKPRTKLRTPLPLKKRMRSSDANKEPRKKTTIYYVTDEIQQEPVYQHVP